MELMSEGAGSFVAPIRSFCDSDLVGSDLPHLLIDVRQIAASVKVPRALR